MQQVSRKVTSTILSMSLLTVMAGAAIAPALGIIKQHFSQEPALLVQFIVSIPALFIIITNVFFLTISRHFRTRAIAIAGLLLYVVTGAGCFFARDIYVILALRALLGVSVGLVMPLSTGLLAYYFPPEEQARLMGLSAAMNQMGGVVATLLAGLLLMMIFFIFPTNFAMVAHEQTSLSDHAITLIMVGLDVVAFFVGMAFGSLMVLFRRGLKYFAPVFFFFGYLSFVLAHGIVLLVLGAVLAGIANGVGVPYLNTIASIKGGRNSATTVMPMLSAALYMGQFVSPIIVTPLSHAVFGDDITGAYKTGLVICVIFLYQVWSTRHFQSLPPVK